MVAAGEGVVAASSCTSSASLCATSTASLAATFVVAVGGVGSSNDGDPERM